MKIKSLYIIIIGIILLCAGCITEKEEPVWSLKVGDKLPEFTVTLNNGETLTTQSLRGKESILIFFTTTCSDCRRMLPEYQRWYEELQSQNKPINFFCISREEGAASVEEYWRANGFTMPFSAQSNRTVYNLFASSGVPRVYIANSDLTITSVRLDE